MPTVTATLRLLLLLAALVNYAAVVSAHDHDAPSLPGDGLCAICVYVGGSLAGAPAPNVLPSVPVWQSLPPYVNRQPWLAPFFSCCSIRGPPNPA